MATTTITATWQAGAYHTANGWHSADGDVWTDDTGRPVQGDEFEATGIRLVGGPRDGVRVA